MTFVLMGVQWTRSGEASTTLVLVAFPCTISLRPASGITSATWILGNAGFGTMLTILPPSGALAVETICKEHSWCGTKSWLSNPVYCGVTVPVNVTEQNAMFSEKELEVISQKPK